MNIAYKCKMCGRPSTAEVGCSTDELQSLGFNLRSWASMLTCNRCYDFRDNYKRTLDKIFRLCRMWEFTNASKRDEAKEAMRDKLNFQTKRLVTLLAEHFNQQNVWDSVIVEGLMEKPDQAASQIHHIYHTVRKGLWANAVQPELVK
jgi:hypothetical protein